MGFRVIGAFHAWRSTVFTHFIDKRYLIANPYIDDQQYLQHILGLAAKYQPLILPVGFIDVAILSQHRTQLPHGAILLAPEIDSLERAADKATLDSLCQNAGVRYPQTVPINDKSWEHAMEIVGLPLVVKSTTDEACPEYAFTKNQLQRIVKARKGPLIAQEFVSGWGTGYFAIAHNGHIVAEYAHRRIVEEQPSGGPSLVACLSLDPHVVQLGRQIVTVLKWTGILMAEFRRQEESGEYYLLEINPKFWGSLELATSWGIDFPRLFIEASLAEDARPQAEKRVQFTSSRIRGCFSWLLPGLTSYLRVNPKVWFRMLWHAMQRNNHTDIHLSDPAELVFGFSTRLINAFRRRSGHRAKILWSKWKRNLYQLVVHIRQQDYGALVFDVDGTLANLNVDWRQVRANLVQRGLLPEFEPSVMVGLYQAQKQKHKRFETMSRIVGKYEQQAIQYQLGKEPEIQRSFKQIQAEGIQIGIISKQTEENIQAVINRYEIADVVKVIVGRESGMARQNQAAKALTALKVTPSETILIGDTVGDAVAAARLGMAPVGVSQHPYRFQQFIELGIPSFNHVREFLSLVTRIIQSPKITKRKAN